jgi:predicted dehydrogenase
MGPQDGLTRRGLLLTAAAGAIGRTTASAATEPKPEPGPDGKVYRIGVVSAAIRGKPQPRNGHTWHFAQYLHPAVNLDAIQKFMDPGSAKMFRAYMRNPKCNFGELPFPDTKITHYYDADPAVAVAFTEAFPGVRVARSLEEMVGAVDAVWMGDASGFGDDHFELVAPGLRKGLPTFCDKPIGGSVAGTRKILDFARAHQAPLMSSSLFRHEWGMEAALRARDSGEFGPIRYLIAGVGGGYSPDGWVVYGQHPAWTVVTLLGTGATAVSLYAREDTCHALVTYTDRMPAEIWFGQPSPPSEYCHTAVYFQKKRYEYTPAIEGDFWYGHHYEMFRMAAAFRGMVRTRREPVPHAEILEVTAIVQAAALSAKEGGRMVKLEEVMKE